MKSIVLAGGIGSRLGRYCLGTNKHLLPMGDGSLAIDHPYRVATIIGNGPPLIVTNPEDMFFFSRCFPDSCLIGQSKNKGIGDAISKGEGYCDKGPVFVILGDNIFSNIDIMNIVFTVRKLQGNFGCHIWVKEMEDPRSYGVVEERGGKVYGLEEKPENPKSNLVLTGVFVFDENVWKFLNHKCYYPSERGEYEVVDIIKQYNDITCHKMKGKWKDIGTSQSEYHKILTNKEQIK